mmetsp:Transcript_49361/g.95436  ORF Transcript_49361/g.95436 Transcript_49361/m.95436 type:complete len:214 (+) Transcript_49361:866-1507(+)
MPGGLRPHGGKPCGGGPGAGPGPPPGGGNSASGPPAGPVPGPPPGPVPGSPGSGVTPGVKSGSRGLLAPGSCLRFSAKSTRILEQLSRSPESRTAPSTAMVSANSTWQKSVPLRLLLSNRTSLISPQRSKRSLIISSVASLGKPPTHTVRQSMGLVVSGTALSFPTRYAASGLSSAKSTRIGTPRTGVPASSAALSTASVSQNFTWPNWPFLN